MTVYFIQAGERGPIKIGYADDVAKRKAKMQADNHEPLLLLGVITGDAKTESDFHQRFATARIRGEWFTPTAELVAFTATLSELPSQPRKNPFSDTPLGRWLFVHGLTTQKQFAKRLGVSEAYLSRLISGERTPGGKTLFRIETETGHVVGGADFFDIEPPGPAELAEAS